MDLQPVDVNFTMILGEGGAMVWNNGNCPVHWAIKCWPGANEAAVTSWKW